MTTQPCYLYSVTNKVNGMQYIGVSFNPARRFVAHASNKKAKSYLRSAIHFYGRKNFELKILVVSDRRNCLEMEAKAIKTFNTLAPNGYNFCGGGEGPVAVLSGERNPRFGKPLPQETKDKISAAHMGRKRPPEVGQKLRAKFTGRPISEEQKIKISNSLKGRTHSDEYKAKMSAVLKGRVMSEEWKNKIKIANTGKKHTPETIEKIRNLKQGLKPSAKSNEKHSNTLKALWANDAFRAKMMEARKAARLKKLGVVS